MEAFISKLHECPCFHKAVPLVDVAQATAATEHGGAVYLKR